MAADSRPKASVLLSLLCFAFLLFSRVPSLLEVGDVNPAFEHHTLPQRGPQTGLERGAA